MSDSKTEKVTKLVRGVTTNHPVDAKHCLWFCWSDPSRVGPENEGDPVNDTVPFTAYKPQAVEGFTEEDDITVKLLDPTQQWTHHMNPEGGGFYTDPGGRDVTRSLQTDGYQNNQYGSTGIQRLTARLNELVYMWEYGEADPVGDGMQYALGHDLVSNGGSYTFAVSTGAKKLFFGFHDGRHWTNNDGRIVLSVTAE